MCPPLHTSLDACSHHLTSLGDTWHALLTTPPLMPRGRYALVVTGSLAITSPPPGVPRPPPPRPPAPPGGPLGDAVAVGLAIPLLLLAVGAGGCFLCRRQAGAPPTSTSTAGGGGLLPQGWRQLRDPSSGAPYYLNEANGTTQWEPPPMPKPPPPAPPAAGVAAPWQAVVDPATNRTYYYNGETGATQWTVPT